MPYALAVMDANHTGGRAGSAKENGTVTVKVEEKGK